MEAAQPGKGRRIRIIGGGPSSLATIVSRFFFEQESMMKSLLWKGVVFVGKAVWVAVFDVSLLFLWLRSFFGHRIRVR